MSGYGYDYNEGSNYQYGYNDAYGNEYGGNGPVADEMGGGYGDFMYREEGEMGDNMNGIDDDAGLAEGLPNGEDDMGMGSSVSDGVDDEIDFDDPRIANLPRILLMGPRRAGKTSIQASFIISRRVCGIFLEFPLKIRSRSFKILNCFILSFYFMTNLHSFNKYPFENTINCLPLSSMEQS